MNTSLDSIEVDKLIENENLEENKISVPKKISKYHILVKQFLNSHKVKYARSELAIKVSSGRLKRAARIFNTLIVELENRGYVVKINKDGWNPKTLVIMRGQEIELRLIEPNKKILNPKYEDDRYYGNKYILEPTDTLLLKIEGYLYLGERQTTIIKDQKSTKLEDRLNEFIICLLKYSEYERLREIESARWKKEYEEKLRLEKMAEEEIRIENEKRLQFKNEVENYILSKQMLEYIEVRKEKHLAENGNIIEDSEFANWVEWSTKYVNSFL